VTVIVVMILMTIRDKTAATATVRIILIVVDNIAGTLVSQ